MISLVSFFLRATKKVATKKNTKTLTNKHTNSRNSGLNFTELQLVEKSGLASGIKLLYQERKQSKQEEL